ncbi:hypothetical protein OG974_30090 (plasmid) [Streptomyces sp. NBC_00597]|uniref:hypothetical protein n=1 Tax=unclassified Streptomyces TaxID=2593676 RepID=UPI002E1234E2|nr:hypothetical protein OG573_33400 [Streptomyces sp. NBC_01205]WSR28816.1 hypothetical protein OG573_40090 [Streptomyces sp. NBC_01205]
MSDYQDPFAVCYPALLPWAQSSRQDDLHRAVRTAVERSLVVLWGDIDLEKPATDADVHAIVAASDTYVQGWFDAVIRPAAHYPPNNWGWPSSLGVWLDASKSHGRGRAFRHTIAENLDFFARFPFWETLHLVGYAEHAARTTTGTPRQRAADATAEALRWAWARHADRLGWDDAEWYEYVKVNELIGWTTAALQLPGVRPSQAADRVEEIAGQKWDNWSPWTSDELPAPFIAQAAQAVADCVATSAATSSSTPPPQAPWSSGSEHDRQDRS